MSGPLAGGHVKPGTRVGGYEVLELLGQGGAGRVYRGYQKALDRHVAIKVLNLLGSGDPQASSRFHQEARAIAHLHHPHIVSVYDYGEVDDVPYMVVEYIAGGSLAGRLGDGHAPDTTETMRILRDVASALDHAHRQGIVHRDVKPANILLSAEDGAVLADFGLAKLLDDTALHSMTGLTSGTPAYIAPEQVAGEHVGAAADVYSLGIVAYQLLVGRVPFADAGVMKLLYAHVNREAPPPSTFRPELGPDVDCVFERTLAKDPKQRWLTCTAFVDALELALRPDPKRRLPLGRPRPRPQSRFRRMALLLAVSSLPLALSWPGDFQSMPGVNLVRPLHARPAGDGFGEALLIGGPQPERGVGPAQAGSVAGGSADPSPSGSTPGSAPSGSAPVGSSQPAPSAPPAAPPPPPAQVQPSPSPSPTGPAFTYSPNPVRIDRDITVNGVRYDPSRRAIITLVQGGQNQRLTPPEGQLVAANGSFTFTDTVPSDFSPGAATLTVCNVGGSNCRSQTITLTN